jgi:hypothetical protein
LFARYSRNTLFISKRFSAAMGLVAFSVSRRFEAAISTDSVQHELLTG